MTTSTDTPPPQPRLLARFGIHDSWYFRESRGHDAIGVSELGSLFPPPPGTIAGAVKTWIGEQLGADWRALRNDDQQLPLPGGGSVGAHELLGTDGGDAALALDGLWLRRGEEVLYPAPALLLENPGADPARYFRLQPGEPVHCDLGRVRLPAVAGRPPPGLRPLEGAWITLAGLASVLQGGLPEPDQLVYAADLAADEARLGIARDNRLGTVVEGKLYQTRHLRLNDAIAVECAVSGLPEALARTFDQRRDLIRFGGEGRQAALHLQRAALPLPAAPRPDKSSELVLVLLTAARFEREGRPDWLPDGFAPVAEEDGACRWRGTLHGIELEITSAVLGKAVREGGWDMAQHRPRPVRSLVPAGSCYFCKPLHATPQDAINALHGRHAGGDRTLGRGLLACGTATNTR